MKKQTKGKTRTKRFIQTLQTSSCVGSNQRVTFKGEKVSTFLSFLSFYTVPYGFFTELTMFCTVLALFCIGVS